MTGILAYGSLLTDPRCEIEAASDRRIEGVITPFEVEYARSSTSRCGAPTLVPVPDGKGARVHAEVLVLRSDVSWQESKDILYRRETNRVGDNSTTYDEDAQLHKRNPVLIRSLNDFAGVPLVLYARLGANISAITAHDLSVEEKARKLAELAVKSVTQETFAQCRDGIRYLSNAISHGVHTPLTEPYKRAILQMAGNAPDLETAHQRIAQGKGIIPEEAA